MFFQRVHFGCIGMKSAWFPVKQQVFKFRGKMMRNIFTSIPIFDEIGYNLCGIVSFGRKSLKKGRMGDCVLTVKRPLGRLVQA